MNESAQQESSQQRKTIRRSLLKDGVTRIVTFVGRNKKPFGIAGVIFVIITVWLLHRDGFKPGESTGEITITTSGGDVLMTVPEQTATTETQTDENL